MDLTGIEVLENDRRIITQAKTEVDSQARKMLSSGISGLVGFTFLHFVHFLS